MGIVPGWLLAAAIAVGIGHVPMTPCLAICAGGMNLTLWAMTGNQRNGSVAAMPLCMLAIHYLVLLDTQEGTRDATGQLHGLYRFLEIFGSTHAVCAFSLIAIVTGILATWEQAHRGGA